MKQLSTIAILLFGFILQIQAATFTVTNLNDSGAGSLRQAIADANTTAENDTINFQSGLSGTITLTSGELAVNNASTAGTLTIANSTGASNLLISGNNTSRVFFVNTGANLTIDGLTITKGNGTGTTDSTFSVDGGGIISRGTFTLINSIVSGNSAITGGGGIANFSGTLTLINSIVSGNTGGFNGGGININGGSSSTLILTNSIVSGNTARSGGGIINFNTSTLTNSTVSGNTAAFGGGIYNLNGATLNLTSVTVTQNKSTDTSCAVCAAGGIVNANDSMANLKNTIVAGNINANAASSPDFNGDVAAGSSYNLIGNGQGTTGISNGINGNQVGTPTNPIDPKLGALQNNGGTTQTHALLPGSPAINAGNNQNAPATDQRGFARIVGGIIDIGAYELQDVSPNPTPTPTPNPQPNCAFTLNPNAQSFASGSGQSGSFTISASSEDCFYGIFSNDSFVTIIDGGAGRGSSGASYTVDANSGAARTGTITVGGETFTVNQAAGGRRKKMLLSPVNNFQ